ncbi:MAG: family 43 glycosylhydrolase [Lachnospiraceae bacterium]|nr:family 43 glycosylhydrolase [Lachnospiraceae bacterium]
MSICNPYLPLDEYIPDAEPHVFGNRVYIYGSHDKEKGSRFCMEDYVVYSAPVDDLSDWTCHGISYKKSQDPRSSKDKLVDFYAPDCVRGNDGKYYLYYFAAGPNTKAFGPMSVAVSDRPEGPFEYVGDIQYSSGEPVLDFLTNDPAVINDDGKIWLYYGWGLGRDFRNPMMKPIYNTVLKKIGNRSIEDIKSTEPSILSCAVVELEEDMITVKGKPKAVLDSKTTAPKDSLLYHHAFYEAASIRKIHNLYYLVYSSGENNELCYATSQYPDREFEYRGVIISNSNLGYQGNVQRMAPAGTIHGGIECINGKYYVFYHRCTNNTDFSRQACAEPIEILEDGTIPQVGISSQGLNGKPLEASGTYSAAICCYLYNENTKNVQGVGHEKEQPTVTAENGEMLVTAVTNHTKIGYCNFINMGNKKLQLKIRGDGGTVKVYSKENGATKGELVFQPSDDWQVIEIPHCLPKEESMLLLEYIGIGSIDILQLNWI